MALYLAQHSGRCYGTLFSDEADGALDPARKRMFLAMKREVLRLGGYAREIFISQTLELTAMADAVIDLDALAGGAPGVMLEKVIAPSFSSSVYVSVNSSVHCSKTEEES